ncbi:MAG: 50S ribosomal protein L22 [Oligoflexales bacterium]|nr:50S ribosomal protein L22 [Oligoflexales bacterium]
MSRAYLKGVRISPRKARLVVDLVRGRPVQEALDILLQMNKKAAPLVAGLINSAIANAKQSMSVDIDRLFVESAFVDGGPMFQRSMPRAKGRATPIKKRTSHITIELADF